LVSPLPGIGRVLYLCWCSAYHIIVDLDVHGAFLHDIPRVFVSSTASFGFVLLVFGYRWKEFLEVFQVALIVRSYDEDDFIKHATILYEVALKRTCQPKLNMSRLDVV
jgi:hypothetical protein